MTAYWEMRFRGMLTVSYNAQTDFPVSVVFHLIMKTGFTHANSETGRGQQCL